MTLNRAEPASAPQDPGRQGPSRTLRPEQLRDLVGIPLSDEQLLAACAPLEPGVIVAGAGSGKTTVMAARVVWLVSTGAVRPEEVLGLTFTTKAVAGLLAKIRQALRRAWKSAPARSVTPAHSGDPMVATYHAFAAGLLDEHGLRIGVEPGRRLLPDARRHQLAYRTLCRTQLPTDALATAPVGLVRLLLALDDLLAEYAVTPQQLTYFDTALIARLAHAAPNTATRTLLETSAARIELAGLVAEFRAVKQEWDVLDFADQVRLAAELAVAAPQVGEAIRRRYRVVLLDEYQDTSVAQRVLLQALFSAGHPVTAVGDPCQAIYGWRGASVHNIDAFPVHFPASVLPATEQPLMTVERMSAGRLSADPATRPADDSRYAHAWAPPVGGTPPAENLTVGGTPPAENLTYDCLGVPPDTGNERFDAATRPATRYSLAANRRSGSAILAVANALAEPLRAEHPGVAALRAEAVERGSGQVRCALLPTFEAEVRWVGDELLRLHDGGIAWSDIAILGRVTADLVSLTQHLTARGIPCTLAGAAALLERPEIVDLVSTLEVLYDPGANVALLRLLAGPRWRLGPRDLAALGSWAADLSGHRCAPAAACVTDALVAALADVDDTDLPALAEAIDDIAQRVSSLDRRHRQEAVPLTRGSATLSFEAAQRVATCAAEFRGLRRHLVDPPLDLAHRVLEVTGLGLELESSPTAARDGRSAAMAAFLALLGDFRGVDGSTDLGSFLAWVRDCARYDEMPGAELPGPADAVALLTVHKAKGLEFPVVFVPFLADGVFPARRGRLRWPSDRAGVPQVLRDEPAPAVLRDYPPAQPQPKDRTAFDRECRRVDELEELRLAYVAVTRAERLLVASGHWWGPTQQRRRGPSEILLGIRAALSMAATPPTAAPVPTEAPPSMAAAAAASSAEPDDPWAPEPEPDAVNPALGTGGRSLRWPLPADPATTAGRADGAALVRQALRRGLRPADLTGAVSPQQRELVAGWDHDLDLILAELARGVGQQRAVATPAVLSTTALVTLVRDPDAFTSRLVRPMPRPPSRAARRGTAFHAWLEARSGQLPLLTWDEVPGAGDDDATGPLDAELTGLQEAFERTPYAHLVPHAVEVPFSLPLGGRVVVGRIDAVFARPDDAQQPWEVVDWKTGRSAPDPLQLAVYRSAWAQRVGIPEVKVRAVFVHVADARVEVVSQLPDRLELSRLLAGPASAGDPADGPAVGPADGPAGETQV